jgi:hypothetical protein
LTEKEDYYLPDECSETVYMDECEASMYIYEEGKNDPNSQENVAQTRVFVNRPKNKGDFDKEKEKASENVSNEKVKARTTRQPVMTSSTQMTYNVVDDLIKLRINLSFTEVMKIPQQRKNTLKFLDDPSKRTEAVVTTPK